MISLSFRMGTLQNPSEVAAATITAAVLPAIRSVSTGGTLAGTLAASATATANYLSQAGTIVSATAEWSVGGAAWAALGTPVVTTGQTVAARVTVTDSKGNRRVFGAGTTVVLPLVPRVTGSLADLLVRIGTAIAVVETAAAFTGEGLAFSLAPTSGDIAGLGLTLDPATGRISGTPVALVAARTVVVRASNAAGQVDAGFSLTVGDKPATMAAPTVTATGPTGLLVVRAAAPASSNAAILRHDLRHSPDGATWTEVPDIQETTPLNGLAAGKTYSVQTRAVNALGAGAWSASGQASTPAVSITASVPPAMAALYDGQAVQDVPGYAAMVSAGNFTAAGSSIASVTLAFLGDATTAAARLSEGQTAGFRVTVTAASGTVAVFSTALVTVAYAVRLETASDNQILIDINSIVPTTTAVPVTVTEEPWASRGAWPVSVSQAGLAAGPVALVAPLIAGTGAVGQVLTLSPGLWVYDDNAEEPVLTRQWRRDGTAIAGATAETYTLVAADAGRTITATETATTSAGSRSATSAGLAVAGGASLAASVSGSTITTSALDIVPTPVATTSGSTITVTAWGY